jgi:thiamine biosynthesis lipoprotein
MGTYYALQWHGAAGGTCQFEQASIAALLDQINRAMSTYLPDSELSQLNQFAAETSFALSPGLARVLSVAQTVSQQSGGAFDVTVGPLVNLWGFGPQDGVIEPTIKQQQQVAAWVGMDKLQLHNHEVRKTRKEVYVDLSALAKGYAVDRIAEHLQQAGCINFMVDIGGEIRTAGLNRQRQPWQIGIEVPDPHKLGTLQAVVGLTDISIATSGDYRNFRLVDGVRIDHVVDPRSGVPANNLVVSATVLHESAMWADAYATTLMVLGVEAGLAFADAQGFPAYIMYRTSDTDASADLTFEARYNEQMAAFLVDNAPG